MRAVAIDSQGKATRTIGGHEVKCASQEKHKGQHYADVFQTSPDDAVCPIAQTLGYAVCDRHVLTHAMQAVID